MTSRIIANEIAGIYRPDIAGNRDITFKYINIVEAASHEANKSNSKVIKEETE